MRFNCKKCGLDMPESAFRIHKSGYRVGTCQPCESKYQQERYAANIEASRSKKREHMARKRAANPEAARAYKRELYAKNQERESAKMREYAGRRFFWVKAMKLRGPERATTKQIASLWKQQRGLCALTGRRLGRSAQLDHILPRARGGGDHIDNLRWTSQEANIAKRDMTDAEFLCLCQDVMSWIGKRISEALKGHGEVAA